MLLEVKNLDDFLKGGAHETKYYNNSLSGAVWCSYGDDVERSLLDKRDKNKRRDSIRWFLGCSMYSKR